MQLGNLLLVEGTSFNRILHWCSSCYLLQTNFWRIRRLWSFVILQKLGIDQKTIKKSINVRSVDCILSLPLVTRLSIPHLPSRCIVDYRTLRGWRQRDIKRDNCDWIAIFAVVYLIVYQITLRSYYRVLNIVNSNSKRGFRAIFLYFSSEQKCKKWG